MVRVFALYSDDSNSNTAEVNSFCKLFAKNENKQKEAGDNPFL